MNQEAFDKSVEASLKLADHFQRQATCVLLGEVWAAVHALGGTFNSLDSYVFGYADAIRDALIAVEKLGGVDPLAVTVEEEKP